MNNLVDILSYKNVSNCIGDGSMILHERRDNEELNGKPVIDKLYQIKFIDS